MNALLVLIPLYIVLIVFCFRLSGAKKIYKSIYFYFSILSFTAVVGLRYMVGNDYPSYLNSLLYGYGVERLEPFSRYTMEFIRTHRIWPYSWFLLCAAIQISFVLLGFKDQKKILPYGIFFFLFYFLGFYISGVRQANAISCVFFAFTFIKDRKLVPYILLLAFAFLNHRSAIIALPVYWVFNFDKILGIKTQFLIIFSGFFIGQTIIFYLVDNYGDYLTLLGYDYLVDQIHDNEMKIEVESGLGIIFNYLVYSIIVIYSRKLYTYFQQDKNFYIYYNLFVFSVFCYGFTMHDQYLSRMTNFFRMSVPVILAYATFYAVCKRDFRIIWYPIIALYIILEIYKWSNSEWFFVF